MSGTPDTRAADPRGEAPGEGSPSGEATEGGAEDRASPKKRFTWQRLILLVFSVALFAVILWLGGVESWRTVLAGDPKLYLVVMLITGVVPALSAWRLRTLVKAATGSASAPWRRYFHINMTAIALGLFLPRNAAMLGGKAAYLKTVGVPFLRGTWAVLMENVVDLLFLSAIVLPCILVLFFDIDGTTFLTATVGCVTSLLVIALLLRGRDWRGFVTALVNRVPFVSSRIPAPDGGFVPGPVRSLPMLATTVVIHMLMAFRAYVIALAIGLEPSLLLFAAAYPLTQLGLALAVAPGALGTLDASWLGLLILGGMPNSDALSFTVALRACIVVFPMIWYGVSALLSLTITSERSPATRVAGGEGAS